MNDPVIRHRAHHAPRRPVAARIDLATFTATDKRDLAWFSVVLLSMPALMLAAALAFD